MNIAFRYAAKSDVGLTRANNQDSAYAGQHLLVVADGMGGHAGGDIASSLVVAGLAPLDDETPTAENALDMLQQAAEASREEILERVQEEPDLGGMGTTLTAIVRSGTKLALGHVGDSRAYLLHDGELTQVTADHTFVDFLLRTGQLTPEEAAHHPQRNLVLRVLGDVGMDAELDLSVREAHPGDRWMLCSDGLSGLVSEQTLHETLQEIADPDECATVLVDLALRAGGPDNITCIVADVVDIDELPDGAAPSAAPQVVGAAAIDRGRPSRGGGGAAARAAELLPRPDADPDDALPARRRRRWPWVVVALAIVALGAGLFFGYEWTQTRYYVGISDGKVAIYQGIDQSLGPWHLSHVESTTGIEVADLPEWVRQKLEDTSMQADSMAGAEELVANLRQQQTSNGTGG